ncbi:Histidine acid phosphatase [Trichostrongylus colubriformis]|uniref:Histidine acid phosphatase n=1 Tax=Trichostrongylus colubriformis TaxID=6319 RepID=A0AAN8F5X5_TRICO
MTMQVFLAGLYKPVARADWDPFREFLWSPVPYTIDDPTLRMYAVKECTNSDRVWKPINEDSLPTLAEAKKKSTILLHYIEKKSGWSIKSLGKLACLADNLIEIVAYIEDMYNASYPTWLLHPELRGYDKEKIVAEIMSFAEMPQIVCANYAPCLMSYLMAGVWLRHILSIIGDPAKESSPRIVGYALHTEVTLALMKLIGIEKDELTTSAGFIIEYRSKPAPSTRLLNHGPNPIDDHVIYKAISDWKKACGINSDC